MWFAISPPQVYVGQPAEFPAINKKGIVIEPGREHFLSLNTQVISANKKIKSLTSEERNCFFPAEGNLEFYDLYSYDNCMLECKIKITEKKLNCTPWFLPHRSLQTIINGIVDFLVSVQQQEKSVIPGLEENSWKCLIRLHQECFLSKFFSSPFSSAKVLVASQVTDKDDIQRSQSHDLFFGIFC